MKSSECVNKNEQSRALEPGGPGFIAGLRAFLMEEQEASLLSVSVSSSVRGDKHW